MAHRLKIALIALFVIAIGCVFALRNNSKAQGLQIAQLEHFPALETLDLILRYGFDRDSEVIAYLSNSRYSHIGVVISLNPPQILHLSTNDTNYRAQIQSLEAFLANARRVGIARLDIDNATKSNIIAALLNALDKPFNLAPDGLYCTTLIESAFAPYLTHKLHRRNIDIVVFGGDYLFPQAFLQTPQSTLIYEYPLND